MLTCIPAGGHAGSTNEPEVFCQVLTVGKFRTPVPCDVEETPMSSFAAHILVSTLRGCLLAGRVVAGFLAVTLVPSFSVAGPVDDTIPQLGSRDSGWNVNFWDFQLDPPPGSGHGPMKIDPKYPYRSQCQNGGCSGGTDSQDEVVSKAGVAVIEQLPATNK